LVTVQGRTINFSTNFQSPYSFQQVIAAYSTVTR